ncbi:hypothetical protein G9A89_007032 [Geosiphon pyriformis]|nr:hypothetical protein G9A89_007032 [Geosiphon pyriformis]
MPETIQPSSSSSTNNQPPVIGTSTDSKNDPPKYSPRVTDVNTPTDEVPLGQLIYPSHSVDLTVPPPPYKPREGRNSSFQHHDYYYYYYSSSSSSSSSSSHQPHYPYNVQTITDAARPHLPPNLPATQPTTITMEYVPLVILEKGPTSMYCPNCRQQVVTTIGRTPATQAYCCSAILCFVCWPLFWVPCLMRSFQKKFHKCSECNRVLALIERDI